MTQIPVQMLKPGMTIATDVQNRRGQILIPSGVRITEKHMRGMKIWGIESVDVQPEDLDAETLSQSLPNAEAPNESELDSYLSHLFVHNMDNMQHPFILELEELCRDVFTRKGIPKNTSQLAVADTPAPTETRSRDELKSTALLMKKSKNLASPPDIYAKLMEAMERSSSSSSSIAAVIENDPGLTARLLRIVNSAFYSFPTPIETISRAITIVGTDELRNMVLVTSVIKQFSNGLEGLLDMEQFWRHSIACALFSKNIAVMRNDQNAERFFTTGLLHDIGRLIMYLELPGEMVALFKETPDDDRDLYRKERMEFGFTHAQMGKDLAESWRLSPRQAEAIQLHHAPKGARRFPLDTAILHVADILTNALRIGTSGSLRIPQFVPDTYEQLRFRPGALARLSQDVEREVSELIRAFHEKKQ
ncbi:MAG: HDOD domain-containing protein [Deltaproteobacteria bacterium]|nr:HDOD domain-containing protein [Deltaproteobacteria bacterium]